MRKGIVQSVDATLNEGLISDENEQEIVFSLDDQKSELCCGDLVLFEIVLKINGLRAVNVILAPLTLHHYLKKLSDRGDMEIFN